MRPILSFLILFAAFQVVPAQPMAIQPTRIGTFDSRAIAIAFAQTPAFAKEMQQLQAEVATAKAEKNESLLKQLSGRGMTQQRLLHLQGFSTGSVTEILAKYPSALAEVAQEAKVSVIVSQYEVQFRSPAVETVDITEALVRKINDAPQVLQMLPELKDHAPISLLEAIALPADK